jgi:hypothetical protein
MSIDRRDQGLKSFASLGKLRAKETTYVRHQETKVFCFFSSEKKTLLS